MGAIEHKQKLDMELDKGDNSVEYCLLLRICPWLLLTDLSYRVVVEVVKTPAGFVNGDAKWSSGAMKVFRRYGRYGLHGTVSNHIPQAG